MSWLSDRLGLHLGNIGAPVGGLIGSVIPGIGTTLGAALGQGLGALGQGKGIGQAALQGGATYLGGKALGALGHAFSPGSSAATTAGADYVGPSGVATANGPWQAAANAAGGGGGSSLASSLGLSSLGNAAKSAGTWAAEHPQAVSAGLQGLGAIGQMDSANALRKAQAQQLQAETDQTQATLAAQKQRSQQLMALFQAFGAKNPNGFGSYPTAPAYQTPNFSPTGR